MIDVFLHKRTTASDFSCVYICYVLHPCVSTVYLLTHWQHACTQTTACQHLTVM